MHVEEAERENMIVYFVEYLSVYLCADIRYAHELEDGTMRSHEVRSIASPENP